MGTLAFMIGLGGLLFVGIFVLMSLPKETREITVVRKSRSSLQMAIEGTPSITDDEAKQ